MVKSKCLITAEGRECAKCGIYKPWSEFSNSKSGTHGHTSRCKKCISEGEGHRYNAPRTDCTINDLGRECTRCREFKEWSEYGCGSGPIGYRSRCLRCESEARGRKYGGKRKRYVIDDSGRECSKCEQYLLWEKFSKNSCSSTGYASRCKGCEARERLKANFGIEQHQYNKMLEEQEGVCAICGQSETCIDNSQNGEIKALAVDHNHNTGAVRGLLCNRCNVGLGAFGDDIDILKSAIIYLEKESEIQSRRNTKGEST